MDEHLVHTTDDYTKAERQRSEALAAAALVLQNYTPPSGKTRAGAVVEVARYLERYLADTL